MGETRTANRGIEMSHGEIVAIVNSDDPLLPGAVSQAVALLVARPEVLVAYPDWNYIGQTSQVLGRVQVPDYDYLHMLKRHHCIVGPGAFIRREAIAVAGLRDPEFKYVADYEFWLRLGLVGPFARIPQTLATFRVHPTSASLAAQGRAMAQEHIRMMQKYFGRPDLDPSYRAVRREAMAWAHYVAGGSSGADQRTARYHYRRALLLWPAGFKATWKSMASVCLPKTLIAVLRPCWRGTQKLYSLALRCARHAKRLLRGIFLR
jgi:hypothetical protein